MSERRFPIMATGSETVGYPRSIPWAMLTANEAQARDNHSQSLERLAERGGLDATEALAILEGRRWRRMDIAEAAARLSELVAAYEANDRDNIVRQVLLDELLAMDDEQDDDWCWVDAIAQLRAKYSQSKAGT